MISMLCPGQESTIIHKILLSIADLELAIIVKGSRGIVLMNREGYEYGQNKKYNSKIYWRCKAKNFKCCATAATDGMYVLSWTGQHNHPVP